MDYLSIPSSTFLIFKLRSPTKAVCLNLDNSTMQMPRPCRLPTCCLTTEYSKTQQFCSLYITIHWKKYFKYPYHHLKSGPRSSYRPGFGPLLHVDTIKDTANPLGATGSSGNSYYEIKSQVFQRQLGGFCEIPCYTVPFIWYFNVILSLPRMGTLLPYNAFISHTSVAELVDEVHVSRTLANTRLPARQTYSGADRDQAW